MRSRHAPRTGRFERWLGPLYFTRPLWYRLASFSVRSFPDWLLRPIVHVSSDVAWCCLPGVRRALAANMHAVLGPAGGWERLRRSRRAIRAFAWCLTERYEQFIPHKRFEVTIEGREVWDELIASPRGFVLVTAHFGGWEMGSVLPALRSEREIHVVREPELDEGAQRFVAEQLASHGGPRYRTHFAEGDLELGLELLRALEGGHVVALQGDRPRAGGKSVSAELFGEACEFPVGVPTLARLARAPLVPVFVTRTGRRRVRVEFRAPIEVPRTADRDADHLFAVQRYAEALEAAIRAAPEQWFRLGSDHCRARPAGDE